MRRLIGRLALAAFTILAATACGHSSAPEVVGVRVGYFPNITHAQALVGVADGTFERALGDGVRLDTRVFNAGPSAIEALFAGQIDLAYVGPNPAVNGFVRSNGQALRIIAGAMSGGAVLVVRGDLPVGTPADFHGKRIASPQLGNTQDVALRHWLAAQGLRLADRGGDTTVIPVANPDILTLFQKKELDGAWVPEPWGARLVAEAGGRIYLDERDLWPQRRFVTANLIARTDFLKAHPDVVSRWLGAHVELTRRIESNPAAAKRTINAEIERLTGKRFPDDELDAAWSRMNVTCDPIRESLMKSADAASRLGFLGDTPPDKLNFLLGGLYDLTLLNRVLREKGLPAIE